MTDHLSTTRRGPLDERERREETPVRCNIWPAPVVERVGNPATHAWRNPLPTLCLHGADRRTAARALQTRFMLPFTFRTKEGTEVGEHGNTGDISSESGRERERTLSRPRRLSLCIPVLLSPIIPSKDGPFASRKSQNHVTTSPGRQPAGLARHRKLGRGRKNTGKTKV